MASRAKKTVAFLGVAIVLLVAVPVLILTSARGLYDDLSVEELKEMGQIEGLPKEGVDYVFFDGEFWARVFEGDFRNAFNLEFNDTMLVNNASVTFLDAEEALRLAQVSLRLRLRELETQKFSGSDPKVNEYLKSIRSYQKQAATERVLIYFESLGFTVLMGLLALVIRRSWAPW